MAVFKFSENLWKWAFWMAVFLFYITSMMTILTKEGIYSQAGASILVGIIILYVIFSKRG